MNTTVNRGELGTFPAGSKGLWTLISTVPAADVVGILEEAGRDISHSAEFSATINLFRAPR